MSSITEAQAYEAVYQQWKTVWEPLQPTVPYCFENMKFAEPVVPWARVTLRPLDSVQDTLGGQGGSQWLRQANIWVQLYTLRDTGMGLLASMVDSARKVFEGQSFGGISPAGGARSIPVGIEGKWYEVAVISPVIYYETH